MTDQGKGADDNLARENSDGLRLLRQLTRLSRIRGSPGRRRTNGHSEEVLFELELDGQSYLLLRAQRDNTSVRLSPRECEIARLVAKGLLNKAIGAVLDISAWTVATHLRRIFVKLDVSSRSAMVAELMDRGLLKLPRPTD